MKPVKSGRVAQAKCSVPVVRVQLARSVRLPPRPNQSIVAEVNCAGDKVSEPQGIGTPRYRNPRYQNPCCMEAHRDAVVASEGSGTTRVVLTNQLGFPHWLEAGVELGTGRPVVIIGEEHQQEGCDVGVPWEQWMLGSMGRLRAVMRDSRSRG